MNNLHLFQKYICSQRSKISLFFLSGVKTFMFFYGMWYATRSLWTSLETLAWSKLDCVGFAPESVLLMILLLRLQHCPAHRDSKSFPFLSRVSTSVVTCVCVCTQSCLTLCNPIDCSLPGDFAGKNTGVGCHVLLQGIFLTQGSNLHLCVSFISRQILYHWATSEALLWNFLRLPYFSFLFSLSKLFC